MGVAIPLRVYDRNQGNIVSAQAELIAATREVERLELELFNRFAEAFEGMIKELLANAGDNTERSKESGWDVGEIIVEMHKKLFAVECSPNRYVATFLERMDFDIGAQFTK